MPGREISWTDDMHREFERLFACGTSHSIIAANLNQKFGLLLSRSACIGKASRLKLTRPRLGWREAVVKGLWAEQDPRRIAAAAGQRTSPQRKTKPPVDIKAPAGAGISMDELRPFSRGGSTSCRYPLGTSDANVMMYCGEATVRGSWCPYHREVVYKGGRHATAA